MTAENCRGWLCPLAWIFRWFHRACSGIWQLHQLMQRIPVFDQTMQHPEGWQNSLIDSRGSLCSACCSPWVILVSIDLPRSPRGSLATLSAGESFVTSIMDFECPKSQLVCHDHIVCSMQPLSPRLRQILVHSCPYPMPALRDSVQQSKTSKTKLAVSRICTWRQASFPYPRSGL